MFHPEKKNRKNIQFPRESSVLWQKRKTERCQVSWGAHNMEVQRLFVSFTTTRQAVGADGKILAENYIKLYNTIITGYILCKKNYICNEERTKIERITLFLWISQVWNWKYTMKQVRFNIVYTQRREMWKFLNVFILQFFMLYMKNILVQIFYSISGGSKEDFV